MLILMPVASAIAAGGQLLGNLANQLFAKRNAQMNYEYAEKSAENQYKRQVDFWNMQNAYNDPSAARQRMEAAGLNPTTDMGSNINAAGSASSVPGNEYAQSGPMPVVPTNWSGFAQEVANIYQTAMNGNKLVKEAAKMEMEARLASLRGDGQELDNDLKRFKNNLEYMFGEKNALYESYVKRSSARSAVAQAEVDESTIGNRISEAGLRVGKLESEIKNLDQGTKRMADMTPEEVKKLRLEQDFLRKQRDWYDRIQESVISYNDASSSYMKEEAAYYKERAIQAGFDSVIAEDYAFASAVYGIDLTSLPPHVSNQILQTYSYYHHSLDPATRDSDSYEGETEAVSKILAEYFTSGERELFVRGADRKENEKEKSMSTHAGSKGSRKLPKK